MPQALTAADRLMQLARILRFGASELFLEVQQIQRRRPAEVATGRDADIALLAMGMQEAAQELDRQAADADLQAYLAHRAAGGDVLLLPLPVVVRQPEQHRPAANDAGLLNRVVRAVSRVLRRAA
ncbi:hypothetical protein CIW48_19285 [Methylobacterium sp. P1-11]|nr:hypothetical protein CIW48_19285 [Methylobacterium sp. P1-11]